MATFSLNIQGYSASAELSRPPGARALLVFAHGAGAGMRHAFMEAVTAGLTAASVAVLRYQFPYMEAKKGRPDPQPVLLLTVRAALMAAREQAGDLPLYVGGKSMGGRMSAYALAEMAEADVRGLVFFGFPLHQDGSPSTARAAPLRKLELPMLFLQGTRDKLADLDLVKSVVKDLGKPATLHVVDGADHSFAVLKKSGRTDAEVLTELVATAAAFMGQGE